MDLKEQGRLICQDEFLVCCRGKKHLRRVFLFEDLILFSKTQKVDGGHDVYAYEQSFKAPRQGGRWGPEGTPGCLLLRLFG